MQLDNDYYKKQQHFSYFGIIAVIILWVTYELTSWDIHKFETAKYPFYIIAGLRWFYLQTNSQKISDKNSFIKHYLLTCVFLILGFIKLYSLEDCKSIMVTCLPLIYLLFLHIVVRLFYKTSNFTIIQFGKGGFVDWKGRRNKLPLEKQTPPERKSVLFSFLLFVLPFIVISIFYNLIGQ